MSSEAPAGTIVIYVLVELLLDNVMEVSPLECCFRRPVAEGPERVAARVVAGESRAVEVAPNPPSDSSSAAMDNTCAS